MGYKGVFRPDPKPEKIIKGKDTSKPIKKVTGEGALFKAIWNTRPHKSFVSGENLGSDGHAWHFAHVLPKKKYPDFRLLDRNIVLLTQEQHFLWDNGLRSELLPEPQWREMFELEFQLIEEYNKK